VHIIKGNASGKVWLEPLIEIAYLNGFSQSEQRLITKIIEQHNEDFKKRWHEYFAK
jgi:hypothetical protein